MTDTPRFALPLLEAGQAQKEVTHNEAIAALDLIAQPAVLATGVDVPPSAPAVGQCWLVGANPGGAWAGRSSHLAGWSEGGWRFVAPVPGMAVWHLGNGTVMRFVDGAWRPANTAIAAPMGGAAPDAEARTAIAAILVALRAQGFLAN